MRVLLLGGGGREHALAWKIAQSPRLEALIAAPGNPGIAALPRTVCRPGRPVDPAAMVELAREVAADLVVVGPEDPLAAGVADALRQAGFAVFGPDARSAQIESSKSFAKSFMRRHGIPTAEFETFDSPAAAAERVRRTGPGPVVVKADGLAAGKGVTVCAGPDEALAALAAFQPDERVVLEERLDGREVSLLAICDGERLLPLPPAEDHKQVWDGDRGPNTGGMGVVCPPAGLPAGVAEEVEQAVLRPALRGLAAEGRPFRGVLYAGIMVTREGPKVIEFNARFGDPEAQALLVRLESDLLPVLDLAARGRLDLLVAPASAAPSPLAWRPGASAAVILASAGYPGRYETGRPISGLEQAEALGAVVFHAGTRRLPDGGLATAGGRVLAVTAVGATLDGALARAYAAAEQIQFEGRHMRRDIGRRGAWPS